MNAALAECLVWRHPRPQGVAGRCIGQTDVPVDRRKAKRLAHRIRQQVRRQAGLMGLPRVVITSPLQRCAAVGRILRSWGWRHHVDEALLEMGFGRWDGQVWRDIDQAQVDAWCADFLRHRPGDGESLADVFRRVDAWVKNSLMATVASNGTCLLVGHAGWMLALQWRMTRDDHPAQAVQWPAPPAYGQCLQITLRTQSPT
ncbi:MAG: fructose-2,6-bisphosphatase [Aquabacterium sp.]|uniref:histidine phosphatase family protein n=1 Tax=Aquabacterium sp. TaxID=1872578 RepID=UPI001204D3BF|nr:histidine phosphatase family protein [Aquabacterium sp.]TAK93231.1 MAG: fructose-2,6-bisphosphatase [Aquabacterium sp.]